MNVRDTLPILLLSASLAAACVGPSPPAVVARDSAGIRIVENRRPAWTAEERWTVDEAPLLRIGTAVGEWPYELDSVGGPVRLSDGRIAVPVGRAAQVRIFDPQGRFLTHLGRAGHGPGEFSRPGLVVERGEGDLWVWDGYEGRLSVFSPSGSFEHSVPVPFGSAWAGGFLTGITDDGLLIFTLRRMRPSGTTGERRDPEHLVTFDPATEATHTIAVLAGREKFHANIDEASNMNRVVFGRASFADVGSGSIVYGESDDFELNVVLPNGSATMVIRRLHPPVEVDEASERLAREDAFDRDVANPTLRKLREFAYDHVPARSTLPAFGPILVDDVDNIWVRKSLLPPDSSVVWHVFAPTGRWLGDLETPAGLDVHQIGEDFILGTETDEWDTPYVSVYRLWKPGP